MRRSKNECIDPAKVPCDKARAYLEKKGLLCGVKQKVKPKKSLIDEWFG
jgi:hypothetical protein